MKQNKYFDTKFVSASSYSEYLHLAFLRWVKMNKKSCKKTPRYNEVWNGFWTIRDQTLTISFAEKKATKTRRICKSILPVRNTGEMFSYCLLQGHGERRREKSVKLQVACFKRSEWLYSTQYMFTLRGFHAVMNRWIQNEFRKMHGRCGHQ